MVFREPCRFKTKTQRHKYLPLAHFRVRPPSQAWASGESTGLFLTGGAQLFLLELRLCSWRRASRRRLTDSAVGLPQGPAVTFMPRRLRASAAQPTCSIRRFHRCGVSRPIALHGCQLLKPMFPCPDISAVRSRRPAVSAFASESHLRSPGGISGPAAHPAGPTRASWRGSRVSMHRFARDHPSPSICSRNPELPVAARRESPF
jgi:hypothetical protein